VLVKLFPIFGSHLDLVRDPSNPFSTTGKKEYSSLIRFYRQLAKERYIVEFDHDYFLPNQVRLLEELSRRRLRDG
jgi:hypothetical protein